MKKSLIILFSLLAFVRMNGQIQTSLDVKFGAPSMKMYSSLSDFNLSLSNFSFTGDLKFTGKHFGLGLQYMRNIYHSDDSLYLLYNQLDNTNNNRLSSDRQNDWENDLIALGLVFKTNWKRLNFEAFPKVAIPFRLQAPNRVVSFKDATMQNSFSLYQEKGLTNNFNRIFWGIDCAIKYKFRKNFGVQVFGGIMSNRGLGDGKVTYARAIDLSDKYVSRTEVFNAPTETLVEPYHQFYTGGIGIFFTSNSSGKSDSLDFQDTELKSPLDKAVFSLDTDRRPQFVWTNPDAKTIKHYIFYLYKDGKLVFSKKTKQPFVKHSNQLEKIYKNGQKGEDEQYSWYVETYYKDSNIPLHRASQRSFSMTPGGSTMSIPIATCDSANRKINGAIGYQIEFTLANPNNDEAWHINAIEIRYDPSFGPSSVYNYVAQISPNDDALISLPITVPIGVSSIHVVAKGFYPSIPNVEVNESKTVTLPNCLCNECDKWVFPMKPMEYVGGPRNNMIQVISRGDKSFFELEEELNIQNALPIQEIKAEIVAVQGSPYLPKCNPCIKQTRQMGFFSFGRLRPMLYQKGSVTVGNQIIPTSGYLTARLWKNDGKGTNGANLSNHGISNIIVWNANNSQTGVDLSNDIKFNIPLSFPISGIDQCCLGGFKVCVRYTFKDIDCNVCTYMECYEYDPTYTDENDDDGTPVTPGFNHK